MQVVSLHCNSPFITLRIFVMDIERQKNNVVIKLLQFNNNKTIEFLIKKLTDDNKFALCKDCLTLENIDAALLFLNGLKSGFKLKKGVLFLEDSLKNIREAIINQSKLTNKCEIYEC